MNHKSSSLKTVYFFYDSKEMFHKYIHIRLLDRFKYTELGIRRTPNKSSSFALQRGCGAYMSLLVVIQSIYSEYIALSDVKVGS